MPLDELLKGLGSCQVRTESTDDERDLESDYRELRVLEVDTIHIVCMHIVFLVHSLTHANKQ